LRATYKPEELGYLFDYMELMLWNVELKSKKFVPADPSGVYSI